MPAPSSTPSKSATAREVALQTVRDVFGADKRGAREAFDYRTRRAALDPRDRAFAMELAYGSIKMRRLLDWYLEPYVGARLSTLPPTILEVLRLGAYQLRAMGGVETHAAVFESVGLARKFGHRGTAGLANAVLRRLSEDGREPQPADFSSRNEFLGTRFSMPTWIVNHWEDRFGADALEAMLSGADQPALISLRLDLQRVTRDEALERLAAAGVHAGASNRAGDVVNLARGAPEGFIERFPDWTLQSEAAAMAVETLDPQPGEHVVEFCSGRGNKTLALAARMHDRGRIESLEIDPRKCAQARRALADAGLQSVEIVEGDATQQREVTADAILVDAPCSALGILGRQPEARWRKLPDDPPRLAQTQKTLLAAAVRSLRAGGRLVYSVCTTDRRECEDVVDALLSAHPELRRARADMLATPGIDRGDGFFVALLERSA
ncbi:MAG TPA: transcription antitermination factor NusB [Candidatus Acidoferrales bacterium]|nr:transcription antitermination factor NusB [Candidatus Acidoferrales bacterium]